MLNQQVNKKKQNKWTSNELFICQQTTNKSELLNLKHKPTNNKKQSSVNYKGKNSYEQIKKNLRKKQIKNLKNKKKNQ